MMQPITFSFLYPPQINIDYLIRELKTYNSYLVHERIYENNSGINSLNRFIDNYKIPNIPYDTQLIFTNYNSVMESAICLSNTSNPVDYEQYVRLLKYILCSERISINIFIWIETENPNLPIYNILLNWIRENINDVFVVQLQYNNPMNLDFIGRTLAKYHSWTRKLPVPPCYRGDINNYEKNMIEYKKKFAHRLISKWNHQNHNTDNPPIDINTHISHIGNMTTSFSQIPTVSIEYKTSYYRVNGKNKRVRYADNPRKETQNRCQY